MISAAGVTVSTASLQGAGPGATPRAALQQLQVRPIPHNVAKQLLVRQHYLHSMPGGTKLAFGVFFGQRLMGAATFGAGPTLSYRLVEGASPGDCATLTRFWLDDTLPPNSESRVMGVILRCLKKYTSLKMVLSYASPEIGHLGVIYQAGNWLYIGLSSATPLYDLGDGVLRHSRSLGHSYGTHGVEYFKSKGVPIRTVPQLAKYRYVYFLDKTWHHRLLAPVLPYPKKETAVR